MLSADTGPIPIRRNSKPRNGYRDTMPVDNQKIQIGIRLPAALVRKIDAQRQGRTRAEYCRDLIETGLAVGDHGQTGVSEFLCQAMESLQSQVSEIRKSAVLTERDVGEFLAAIQLLREDLATAIAGVLTKLGQVVREQDQRKFAREKAEAFAKRVLLSKKSKHKEEEP
jgi:hypothetical protein